MFKSIALPALALCLYLTPYAQNKPLDHTVYDAWQRVGEKQLSADGNWVAYTIDPQEGNGTLFLQGLEKAALQRVIPRGYNLQFDPNSRFLFAKIKPLFADTREAKIKKRKPEEQPKDSFLWIDLTLDSVRKVAGVKSYKFPDSTGGWVAWQLEKATVKKIATPKLAAPADTKGDSLRRIIDSLEQRIQLLSTPVKKKNASNDADMVDADEQGIGSTSTEVGTDLVLMNLRTGKQRIISQVVDYQFSPNGFQLALERSVDPDDSTSKPRVQCLDLISDSLYTISRGGNDFRQFTFSADGRDLVFLAERDARPKELLKYMRIWHYRRGMDSAQVLVDRHTPGMRLGHTLSPFGTLRFTPSGNRLFLGTAPIQPPQDTTRIELDLVKLDIWHYKEDYLQSQQLYNLPRDQQRNHLAYYDLNTAHVVQLETPEMPQVLLSQEGDGDRFYGLADSGYRTESQWTGRIRRDLYSIDAESGERLRVLQGASFVLGTSGISPDGSACVWYDLKKRQYRFWNGSRVRDISNGVKRPLWDEENDVPDDPAPHGLVGWLADGSACLVYDRYDLWKLDTLSTQAPTRLTPSGRENKIRYRWVRTQLEAKPWQSGQSYVLRAFRERDKQEQLVVATWDGRTLPLRSITNSTPHLFGSIQKARNANRIIYTRENYQESPNLHTRVMGNEPTAEQTLTQLNPQQADYNWGTAELYRWTALDGKPATGVVYKPQSFDPTKKYPLILYFYETHTDALNQYIPPSPTGSRLNISFFVSRGYVVCSPDIHYTIGQPAQSAFNYVVSAAKSLAAKPWIDGKNMGIQGQSWGGIQVAQLVTMTNLFKAAWSGAPVANMTSAYGGIRWESGLNRQFQYEKTQSRIGATLWERPDLYLKNSPLFQVPKITTPMVIMANDADGAVPWYQGIELFTAMRRLGKASWLLNYNGEAHNLRERKNQKDISIREQQFFDWLLKGEKPAKWITEGIPALQKGKDGGLELVDQ